MIIENKITLKRILKNNPVLAKLVEKGEELALLQLANEANLSLTFVVMHLDTIKRWI